jgi:hypothetical protein
LYRLVDRILGAVEDAKDQRSVRKRTGITVTFDELMVELGLDA